ncbi:MAG TPA: phosphoribosylformylglycinamidine cyclo-ligase [Phycisphaerae bacterium]|nr:phosphoribosylformylglycinamidine cyclo-ligase [Phycisphaerae bacterium]
MSRERSGSVTYKQSGVDIAAGDQMIDLIRPLVRRTENPRVLGSIGGFAGLLRLDFREGLFRRNYRDAVLAACTDSVGSKVKVAIQLGRLDTIGIDVVAMNVNDLICCGAEPLLFLDYLGVGRLDPNRMAQIIKGVADGCVQANCCPLLGGETAELPDLYRREDFDLVGFAVGIVERRRIISGSDARPGDVAIALASSGLHSNGYSLARKVLLKRAGFKFSDRPPELDGASIGEELLSPTMIYVKCVLDILGRYRVKKVVKAMAHITGGGLPGNLPRVLPDGLTVRIKRGSWHVPPIFKLIESAGPVDPLEMTNVFNMGVGFVMIVAPGFAGPIMSRLRRLGQRCWVLGKVRKGGPDVLWA